MKVMDLADLDFQDCFCEESREFDRRMHGTSVDITNSDDQ